MQPRSVVVVAITVVLALACSEAKVVEDSAAACSNQRDDDGDGAVDCNDPDCFPTDACERNAATCSNGIDDDGDGALDCQQESCKTLPICKDAVESACTIAATETGCPRGKGCYITADDRRWCALEGPSLAGGPCGQGDPSDRSQGCAAGYLCMPGNRCARVCRFDHDCTRNSICVGSDVRVCTSSCASQADCHDDEACVALQRIGRKLEDGGWAHQCIARGAAPQAGTAEPGSLCDDPPSDGAPDRACKPGTLCIPEPSGARCREVCRAPSDGQPRGATCPQGSLCYAVVPFSPQPTRFDDPDVVGVCL